VSLIHPCCRRTRDHRPPMMPDRPTRHRRRQARWRDWRRGGWGGETHAPRPRIGVRLAPTTVRVSETSSGPTRTPSRSALSVDSAGRSAVPGDAAVLRAAQRCRNFGRAHDGRPGTARLQQLGLRRHQPKKQQDKAKCRDDGQRYPITSKRHVRRGPLAHDGRRSSMAGWVNGFTVDASCGADS